MKNLLLILLFLSLSGILSCSTTSGGGAGKVPGASSTADDYDDDDIEDDDIDDSKSKKAESSGGEKTPGDSSFASDFEKITLGIKGSSEPEVVQGVSNILIKDKDNLKALNSLGVYYYKSEQYGLAKLIFKRALEVDKENSAIHNNMGILLLAEGNENSAIKSFKASLIGDSSNYSALSNLGSLYLKYGNYADASDLLQRAFRIKSDDSRVGVNYALALEGVGEDDKAASVLEDLLDDNQKDVNLMFNYVKLLVRLNKDKGKAERMLGRIKLIATEPEMLENADQLLKKLEGKK